MADTGKLAVEGFSAGAIKYVTLLGFIPTGPIGSTLVPCLVSMGFGNNAIPKITLHGFAANPAPPPGGGAFYLFGESVVR